MQNYKFVILRNELETDHLLWEAACRNVGVNYRIVNITLFDWLEKIQNEPFDYLLAIPGAISPVYKQLYDERLRIISEELAWPVFPSLQEVLIYENKRYLSYWLKANSVSSPKTWVFYDEGEAMSFIRNAVFPLVAKLNIGASGSGVTILKTKSEAQNYCNKIFTEGIKPIGGPRLVRGNVVKRAIKIVSNPVLLKDKLARYKAVSGNVQKGFLFLQEFIPHSFEWRVVRIGDSFFAHKKLKKGEMASGSLLKNYENPPLSIFDFVKELTDRFNFRSLAIDLFETKKGDYLVNEMQCIFGQSDPYQMLVDGQRGRYIYTSGNWIFEPGDFNTNESYDLRLRYLIETIQSKK